PFKVRPVMELVRGFPVNGALENLQTTHRRGAGMIRKVIQAALAGARQAIAEKRLDLDANDLVVAEARVDEGPTIKRWKPRARGMATGIQKRTCHIHVVLRPPWNV
ncbi:MAG: 50S ribosomal protein L22, partial [Planctomycetota bacterium]